MCYLFILLNHVLLQKSECKQRLLFVELYESMYGRRGGGGGAKRDRLTDRDRYRDWVKQRKKHADK